MNKVKYYQTKAIAVKLGVDAYREAHAPLTADEDTALRHLSKDAWDWDNLAVPLKRMQKSVTLSACLDAHQSFGAVEDVTVVIRDTKGRHIGEVDAALKNVSTLLPPFILQSLAFPLFIDEDDGYARILVEIEDA